MIKIPKSPLYNFLPAALAVITAGLCLRAILKSKPDFILPAVLLPLGALIFAADLIFKRNKSESLEITRFEDTIEKINIAYEQLKIEEQRNGSLDSKIKNYDHLSALTEKLNQNLSLDDTISTILESLKGLFNTGKNTCLIYLIDPQSQKLHLTASNTANPIKEKHGDIFDEWLLKHSQPLLVEDIVSDFRFDADRLKKNVSRQIKSLISCPLTSHKRPTGILRLDSPRPRQFVLEDLRLLNTISDLASVAVDNSRYYQHIQELAITDSLTRLYTRKFILDRLEEEIKRALLTEDTLSIAMIDIDFFKKYNDQHGHLAGDIVLKNLSGWLKEYFKPAFSLIGRIGGEEFLLILPSTSKQEAYSRLEDIRSILQTKTINLRRYPSKITISSGISSCPQDAKNSTELVNCADNALYEAKRNGRNKVCIF